MRDDRPMERTAGMVTGLVAVKRARASLPGQDLPRAAESAFRGGYRLYCKADIGRSTGRCLPNARLPGGGIASQPVAEILDARGRLRRACAIAILTVPVKPRFIEVSPGGSP